MEPLVVSMSRAMSRAVVDLPEPDSPTSARVSRVWTSSETSSTARRRAARPSRPPPCTLNSLTRFLARSSGCGAHRSSSVAAVRSRADLVVDARHGVEEHAGVVLLRVAEDPLGRALLHEVALAHDDEVVGDLADDGEVVGDEDEARAGVAAGFLDQQVQDLLGR